MARLSIDIPGDGSIAMAIVTPGPPLDADAVRQLLATAGLHGIDAAACDALVQKLADASHAGKHAVAHASPAVAGEDGRLELLRPEGPLAGTAHQDQHIDYRERCLLVPVRTGERFARIVPPTRGRPGTDVRGRRIAARDGAPVAVRCGAGARQDGEWLVALRDGVRSHVPPLLDVVPALEHEGDVDYASGNLHTEGSLRVRGDVVQGFTVQARHDVHVLGTAFDATVTAGGAVRLDGGASGAACRIEAGTDLACHHATAATLIAGDTLEIGDAATQCTARARHASATSGRGTWLGGDLRARERITVRVAGNALGTRTTLRVGDVLADAADLVRQHHREGQLANHALRTRQADPRNGKALRTALRANDPVLQQTIAIRQKQRELLSSACIEVVDTLHVGVHLVFGERTHAIDRPRHHVRLRWNEADDTLVEEPLP